MAFREIIKLGADNTIDLLLTADGENTNLSSVTHMAVVFKGVTISSVGRGDWFDWTSGTTGQVSLKLGGVTNITTGSYKAELWVYDESRENGIYWGTFPVWVKG